MIREDGRRERLKKMIPVREESPTIRKQKVVLLGPCGVGKSNLISRFVNNTFKADCETTVGVLYVPCEVETSLGFVTLKIWDTAGQEQFRCLIPMYSRNADAILFVFDVTTESSFENIKDWVYQNKNEQVGNPLYVLVANKIDLENSFNIADAQDFAKEIDADFMQTSALSGLNVNSLFTMVAEKLVKRYAPVTPTSSLPKPEEQPSSCC